MTAAAVLGMNLPLEGQTVLCYVKMRWGGVEPNLPCSIKQSKHVHDDAPLVWMQDATSCMYGTCEFEAQENHGRFQAKDGTHKGFHASKDHSRKEEQMHQRQGVQYDELHELIYSNLPRIWLSGLHGYHMPMKAHLSLWQTSQLWTSPSVALIELSLTRGY